MAGPPDAFKGTRSLGAPFCPGHLRPPESRMDVVGSIETDGRTESASPRIVRVSWGEMEVEGLPAMKDAKLWPGGGREWDWNESGTRHDPGIQPADVDELLAHGSRVIVLSRGQDLQLRTSPATLDLLRDREVTVHIEETKAAVKRYNELAGQGEVVGGLFHSTC